MCGILVGNVSTSVIQYPIDAPSTNLERQVSKPQNPPIFALHSRIILEYAESFVEGLRVSANNKSWQQRQYIGNLSKLQGIDFCRRLNDFSLPQFY